MRANNLNKILTYVSAVAVIIIIAIAAWYFVPGMMALQDQESDLSKEFYGTSKDPVISELRSMESRGASRDEVMRKLPGELTLQVFADDITSDDQTEHILFRTNPDLPGIQQRLIDENYVGQVEGMIIYKNNGEQLRPVFTMTPSSMRNESGKQLIGQIFAEHGYAVKVMDFNDPDYYSTTVKILTIVLVDENGNAASDELTVYWDPGPKVYKATNTFGAPGTFE